MVEARGCVVVVWGKMFLEVEIKRRRLPGSAALLRLQLRAMWRRAKLSSRTLELSCLVMPGVSEAPGIYLFCARQEVHEVKQMSRADRDL